VGGSCNGTTCNATCTDLEKNNGESDVDCGGANCAKCGTGKTCMAANSDCTSLSCSPGNSCLAPTCNDVIKNQGESDVDCGGAELRPLRDEQGLRRRRRLRERHCVGNLCAAPTCNDVIKNQGESDVDCGGPTATRVDGQGLRAQHDCASLHCVGLVCVAPTCADGIKNQNETDVDCSGPCPTKCGPEQDLLGRHRLHRRRLRRWQPAPPTAPTLVKNNVETDVDCGGGTCGGCALTKACVAGSDCRAPDLHRQRLLRRSTAATSDDGHQHDGHGQRGGRLRRRGGQHVRARPASRSASAPSVTFNGDFTFAPAAGRHGDRRSAGAVATPSGGGSLRHRHQRGQLGALRDVEAPAPSRTTAPSTILVGCSARSSSQ
jgi:hypothetical protein